MKIISLLMLLFCMSGIGPLYAETNDRLPDVYRFKTPEAKETWRQGLPEDCIALSPTCVYSKANATVYLLAEFCGLRENYETEFILLGKKSDRGYEGLLIAWDAPSLIAQAVEALGVPKGIRANPARGMALDKGERFTVKLAALAEQPQFYSLEEEVEDTWSTPSENLFGRGFPYVGTQLDDDMMPNSIIATYIESFSVFGMPYAADKSAVYGSFRAKRTHPTGEPIIVALQWQRLPNGLARVCNERLLLTKESLASTDGLIEKLKAYSNDPRDVFLTINLDPQLLLADLVPVSKLFQMVEREGGFTIDLPPEGQLQFRALTPNPQWLEREGRVFQPWEIEISLSDDGETVNTTLCHVEEDWSGEGYEPLLTRKCYPNITPENILSVMEKVDTTNGRIYVVFFYCQPGIKVKDVVPYAEVLKSVCPTQWIFTFDKDEMP